jgi:trehalose 6-phosphate synthase
MDGLLVCSHRGPFTYQLVDGQIQARSGSGGVVTALSSLLRGGEVTWLACALSDMDREVARRGDGPAGAGGIHAHLLDVPATVHRSFYDDACITGLGFLFHGLVDQAYTPTFDTRFRRGWTAYREVNRAYADEIARRGHGQPVLVEDYHLMLVAEELRARPHRRHGPLAYFHHIPWCPPAYFGLLPAAVRREILSGILAFDTLGFHSRRWAEAFLACCDAYLPEARCGVDSVYWDGREVSIVVAPVQVDVAELEAVCASEPAARWRQRLARRVGDRRALVRVDRVDLWKNILRGFLAFEHLVREEGVRDVAFLALLARSRMHVPQYRRYLAACVREARRINRSLNPGGRGGPIHLLLADDHSDQGRALAGLGVADTVLVNSTSDGLNLVAKESVIASGARSRLVLSENTGVYEEIGRWAYGINPFDVLGTAAAIARALADADRPRPVPALREVVGRDLPADWVRRRLAPLMVPPAIAAATA